jgi:acyl-CoA thioesterase I
MKRIPFLFAAIISVFLVQCGNEEKDPGISKPPSGSADTTIPKATTKTILFFGNSLSAGYGVDPSEAFPALIQQKIDSMDLPYKVINGGVSGETTAGGAQRIDFVLKQQPVDVFVLELGGNDGLRGLPLSETRKNLQAIIDKVKTKYPEAKLVLAGMQIPPNMGEAYASEFREIYPELAKKNDMTLIPFLLRGVGGEARYNLQDGIHPTPEGHQIVAENVWQELKTVL